MVELADGRSIEANIISSVPSADVALLKMTRVLSGLKPARLGDSSAASIGSEVMIIGAPFGLEHSLSVGHISGRIGQDRFAGGELMEVIQTDAAVNQGNSGGPMFNLDGEVIGIVSFILSASGGFDGIGFAVAINPAKKILLESPSFWTGFDALFLPPEISQALNVPRNGGLLVQRVIQDSLAGRAGLRGGTIQATVQGREVLLGGDVVLSIAGTACEGPHDFAQIHEDLDRLRDGDPFVIEVLRGGEVIELTGWVQR
jgi:S1-C subfamily serine protease